MGYTHYWRRPSTIPAASFARAAADFQSLGSVLPVALTGTEGTTGRDGPSITRDAIVFNGRGEDAYETFCVPATLSPRSSGMGFCKTARKPYDLAVQLALIVLAHHAGFTVSSDGDDSDWDAARRFCQAHLGYGEDFQLDRN